jgi:hypothetical protein
VLLKKINAFNNSCISRRRQSSNKYFEPSKKIGSKKIGKKLGKN